MTALFKKSCLILTAVLFLSPAWAQVSSQALGAVQYEVRYQRGGVDTKVVDATITLERSTWQGQPALHAHAAIRAASVFRLFMNAEYLADSYLLPENRTPLYYINPIKKGGREGKFECTYDRAAGTVTSLFVRPGADPVQETFPLDGRTMDLLSLLQYIRFLSLPEGRFLSMHVLKAGESVPASLRSEGPDTEKIPGKAADRFMISMPEKGLMENGSGNRILVWRSSGPDRQLLAMEVSLGSGVMVATLKN